MAATIPFIPFIILSAVVIGGIIGCLIALFKKRSFLKNSIQKIRKQNLKYFEHSPQGNKPIDFVGEIDFNFMSKEEQKAFLEAKKKVEKEFQERSKKEVKKKVPKKKVKKTRIKLSKSHKKKRKK